MPIVKENYELIYRAKSGELKTINLKSNDFRNAEIEALEELEKNKKDIAFNKKRRIELILFKGNTRLTYASIWKKSSPLSIDSNVGGYIEGFSKKYSKKEKKEVDKYIEKTSSKNYKVLKVFGVIYWLLSLLILLDMLSDFIMTFEQKRYILNVFKLSGVSVSILFQSLFLFMLIIFSIIQPIVYENFRNNAKNWNELKNKIYMNEIPTLVSTLSTSISLIFVKNSIITFGNATVIYITVLLLIKILITIEYEKDAFYKKLKADFHNKK